MRAIRTKNNLFNDFVLSCYVFLLCSMFTAIVDGRKMAPHHRSSERSRQNQNHYHAKHKSSHHRSLTDEQKADQNLQFMLSLYRSAAEPDGRPKQHRKFGSNTVRLLRPSAYSVRTSLVSGDRHYIFTGEYDLHALPLEQLVRASFIHLRSSSSVSSSPSQALHLPRCRAWVTSLGQESQRSTHPGSSMVTLEPQDQWTEMDITTYVTGHVLQGKNQGRQGHLTLTAQYWCTDSGYAAQSRGPSWRLARGINRTYVRGGSEERRRREASAYHLEVPSLLLYLEEEMDMRGWTGGLLGAEQGHEVKVRRRPSHPVLRQRRSKDFLSLHAKEPSWNSNPLKNSSSSAPSIISNIPNYNRKTSAPKNRCKLHSFRLSFDELGWGHYFIAPPVYNPRFCQGDCPRILHYGYQSPNHAIIQTVINEMGVGEVPAPSCVPYKYMPMSVLVVYKNKVEYKELEDMVAESCTCR